MCMLSLRRASHTLNYPKDTQLNTPSLTRTCDTALRAYTGKGLLSLVIFFTQSISLSNIQLHRRLIRCPPWGGFEQLCLAALFKDQHPPGMFSFEQFEFCLVVSAVPTGLSQLGTFTQDCVLGYFQPSLRDSIIRPTETNLVELTGIEPVTPCLQSRCSPS